MESAWGAVVRNFQRIFSHVRVQCHVALIFLTGMSAMDTIVGSTTWESCVRSLVCLFSFFLPCPSADSFSHGVTSPFVRGDVCGTGGQVGASWTHSLEMVLIVCIGHQRAPTSYSTDVDRPSYIRGRGRGRGGGLLRAISSKEFHGKPRLKAGKVVRTHLLPNKNTQSCYSAPSSLKLKRTASVMGRLTHL